MKALLIAIGNRYRGDDAIGIALGEALKPEIADIADTVINMGDTIDILELWKGREKVYIVDAIATEGGEPGTLHKLFPLREKIAAPYKPSSSHLFDIGQVIELGLLLGNMPQNMLFFAIEASHFDKGAPLSTPLKRRFDDLKNSIEKEIRALSME